MFSWEDASDKVNPGEVRSIDSLYSQALAFSQVPSGIAYCMPWRNIMWERHVLNTHNQHDGETIDQYVTDLKTKAQTCEFKDLKDSLIRDRIVCGIHCDKTCSRLLREPNLTLQKVVDMCRVNETMSSQMKSFTNDQSNDLPAIHGICSQNKQVQKLYYRWWKRGGRGLIPPQNDITLKLSFLEWG